PALLVVATGLWRNVCPMASTALFPMHLQFSREKRLSIATQGRLHVVGVTLLLLLVPLRHVILDTNGLATAGVIIILAICAFILGANYKWKSAWCSGICPIHPVEKLYGSRSAFELPNAHCVSCHQCTIPCPDSTPSMHPLAHTGTPFHHMAGIVMIGAFPGFIWGWFHVPDYQGMEGWNHLDLAYGLPLIGAIISLILFIGLLRWGLVKNVERQFLFFATIAVSCYYWYRLPALLGFGLFPGDGMLVDLSNILPHWFPIASRLVTTSFFIWWLLIRNSDRRSWSIRPPFKLAES
ncbi:MAG: hypothetical protein OEQ53_13165, partial [Saprospiraceae bacterium]|nr:hypothetical protein [Saprospiraceae bacterium]